jgi:hypothetical protein
MELIDQRKQAKYGPTGAPPLVCYVEALSLGNSETENGFYNESAERVAHAIFASMLSSVSISPRARAYGGVQPHAESTDGV